MGEAMTRGDAVTANVAAPPSVLIGTDQRNSMGTHTPRSLVVQQAKLANTRHSPAASTATAGTTTFSGIVSDRPDCCAMV